jgi:hypothetical protein
VDGTHIRAFVRRDWAQVARAKTAHWIAQKAGRSPTEILDAADALRRHAMIVRPEWPSDEDRAADLAAHRRVSEALRAVAVRPR